MTKHPHPITPPIEVWQQWEEDWHRSKVKHVELEPYIAAQAAQWGADQELEACCNWLPKLPPWSADDLRRHRRPKPPSLKEQALETLRSMQIEPCWINGINTNVDLMSKYDTIRRALEQLPDDQG